MRRKLMKGLFGVCFSQVTVFCLTAVLMLGIVTPVKASAQSPTRVVVLPFYVEKGHDAKDAGEIAKYYRRSIRFINNQLVRHGFEVINAFAKELAETEYSRVMERAREDSPLAARDACKKYGAEIAYIVWLNIQPKKTADGYCKVRIGLDGEGYDSAGHDLGVGMYKSFIVTKRDCFDAVAEAGKEIGDVVGRKLTAWSGSTSGSANVIGSKGSGTSSQGGGALARKSKSLENLIEVRLDGATEYTLSEIFGKVVNTARGVVEAKRMASNIVPNNPQACWVTWRLRIEDTDPFRLQSNIMKMVHDILEAGGELHYKGVPYRYTAAEVDLLKGIRPGEATSRRIQFVIDRELARDKEFQERHDPYKAKEKGKTKL